MTRRLIVLALGLAAAACTPVPHPFADHPSSNPLVDDVRIVSTVRVTPIDGATGLNAVVVHELAHEDVLAFTGGTGPMTVTVQGKVEKTKLVWHLLAPDGKEIGKVEQPITPGADNLAIAQSAAPLIVQLLTSDAGRADLSTRPHVVVHMADGPRGIDSRSLGRAMADALTGHGLLVSDDHPVIAIEGVLHILPGSGNQDVLQVDWTVRDGKGASLGTISQGSPVDRARLTGPMSGLAQDIAAAATPGILAVIRQKAPAVLQ